MPEKNFRSIDPVTNMWWAHTEIDSIAIATVAPTNPTYPKIGLRAKTGITSRDDAEERDGDDVDLGVPEEPEQVLPQDRPPVRGRRRAPRGCGLLPTPRARPRGSERR
jgi:hypothetical protein